MKKIKQTKGITLVALILTIVILLILAVVTINSIQGEGIISKAMKAREDYEDAAKKEQGMLDEYLEDMEGISSGENSGENDSSSNGGDSEITISDAQTNDMLAKTTNTTVYDEYGNKIVIPAGFKILVDSTTGYTASDIDVTKGIVITDGTNEFVWIPVGEVKTSAEIKTITLGRYVFDSSGNIDTTLSVTNPSDQLKTSSSESYYYTEGLKNETTSNAHAKDIEAFITSAKANGGYYLGRYEAGDSVATSERTDTTSDENTMVCKAGQYVYNYVTQSQASKLARNMYNSTEFTSDLINSYAWDTAIVFIQTFSGDSDYSGQTSLQNTLAKTGEATNGTNNDVRCNIYDMAGNCWEWSTETCCYASAPCAGSGGYRNNSDCYTSRRHFNSTTMARSIDSFRPLLYV